VSDSTQRLGTVKDGGNGGKWLAATKVAWALLGLLGTVALYLAIVAIGAAATNDVQDVRLNGHDQRITGIEAAIKEHCAEQKADLREIEKLQREILIRLPK
jgi:hypothetical protein